MKKKILTILSAVVILSILLIPSTVSAKNIDADALKNIYIRVANSDDPDKAFSELEPGIQKALIDALTDLKHKVVVDEDSTRGTKTVTVTINVYSDPFGTLIWSFNQQIGWGYDGTYVTSVFSHQSWGSATWPWSYEGLISESEIGGVGYTYFHRFSQGKFSMQIGGIPVQTDTPWINQYVYGNGTHSYTTGGY